MARKILNTNGATVRKTTAQFESYDVIRYSASYPDNDVQLIVKNGGTLNLASELKGVDATITAIGGTLRLTSGSGDDTLIGGRAKDILNGGAGNDALEGKGGNDTLLGGSGNDAFVVSGSRNGVDTFRGGTGTDALFLSGDASLSRLTLDKASSVETINFNYNSLKGTAGADNFNLSNVIRYEGGSQIDLREGDDRFLGSKVADTVYGGAGNDTLKGGLGNDYLVGGNGNDLLYGGSGDDAFGVSGSQNGVDQFTGGSGTDTLYVSDDVQLNRLTLDAAASVETIDLNYNALSGTSGADIFNISGVLNYAGGTRIDLREGNDSFLGSQAADNVLGGDGNDTLSGGNGNDTLTGGVGDDILNGDLGNDYFFVVGSQNGVDTFRGGDGTDVLYVSDDTQLSRLTLDAAASVETIGRNYNALTGTSGADTFNISGVLGYSGGNQIDMREGNDSFLGSQAADYVLGGDGNDTLNGYLGNDQIWGGLGNDTLTGGSGNDRFYFDTGPTGTNVDTIADFTVGADTIELSDTIFTAVGYSLTSTEFVTGTAATTSAHRIIYNSNNGNLYYDSDGTGSAGQVLFAKVDPGLLLSANSFDVY